MGVASLLYTLRMGLSTCCSRVGDVDYLDKDVILKMGLKETNNLHKRIQCVCLT